MNTCDRYAHSVPVMPSLSVPPFNRSSPHCQLAGVGQHPTVTRSKPLDQLDAAHFFSTGSASEPSPTPHAGDTSPWLTPHDGHSSPWLPSVVGGNVAEEYRLLASATQSSAASMAVGASQRHGHGGYLELLDLDALRIVFLLLDAVLLLYRITNVYVGGQHQQQMQYLFCQTEASK